MKGCQLTRGNWAKGENTEMGCVELPFPSAPLHLFLASQGPQNLPNRSKECFFVCEQEEQNQRFGENYSVSRVKAPRRERYFAESWFLLLTSAHSQTRDMYLCAFRDVYRGLHHSYTGTMIPGHTPPLGHGLQMSTLGIGQHSAGGSKTTA